MLTRDFAERTRARVAAARAAVGKLRDASREAIREIAKIDKQHAADRSRVYDRLGQLADDVVDKLPEDVPDDASDRAYAIQEQINDLASDVEEISLAGSSAEDLAGLLTDAVNEIYAHLKDAEAQLSRVERGGAKLGV